MVDTGKKILLSGIQATGRPHIGNYFGAMKQFVDFQDQYDSRIMIADYHSLNTVQNPEELKENIINVALDYLAIGLDPKKVIIFKQSDVQAHTELAWIFNTFTTMPYLMRAHAFKDAEAKNKEISVGTFDYPMLMAADILLYDPDVVPVGQDQKQHVEIARDTAQKFNNLFGETFKSPKELIKDDVKTVPGIDGQKMSKSYHNTIPLFGSDEEIIHAVMGIVTDSAGDKPVNVYNIHALVSEAIGRKSEELEKLYSDNKGKYKILKEGLIEDLKKLIGPMREKREEIAKDKKYILQVLKEGGEKAREIAEKKMTDVREKVGVKLY
jgi:tryptophanyl-tRNA synthetase